MQFDSDRKKVVFSGKVLGFDREYELVVQTMTTWIDRMVLSNDLADGADGRTGKGNDLDTVAI